jgi:hypothetical protein
MDIEPRRFNILNGYAMREPIPGSMPYERGQRNSVMELQPHGHREFSGAGHFQELIGARRPDMHATLAGDARPLHCLGVVIGRSPVPPATIRSPFNSN